MTRAWQGACLRKCGVVAAPDTPVMYYSTAIVEQVVEDQAAGHRRRVGYSRDSGDAADGLVVEDDRRVLDIPDPEDGGPPWTSACAHLNGKPKLFTNVLCRGKEEVLAKHTLTLRVCGIEDLPQLTAEESCIRVSPEDLHIRCVGHDISAWGRANGLGREDEGIWQPQRREEAARRRREEEREAAHARRASTAARRAARAAARGDAAPGGAAGDDEA